MHCKTSGVSDYFAQGMHHLFMLPPMPYFCIFCDLFGVSCLDKPLFMLTGFSSFVE